MKYLLTLFIILACIGTMDFKNKSFTENMKSIFFTYITSLDNTYDYLVDNFEFVDKFNNLGYKLNYDKFMSDRYLVEHKVLPGENLDSIIRMYNSNLDKSKDIEALREIVYVENKGKVTSDYNIQSWDYILIPSE